MPTLEEMQKTEREAAKMIVPKTPIPQKDRKQPTKRELAERIEFCRKLIGSGIRDSDIKRAVASKYGCQPRSAERYLCRAREIILAHIGRPRQELRAESYEFYLSQAADTRLPARERRLARKRIDDLLGLNAPQEHKVGGAILTGDMGEFVADLIQTMDSADTGVVDLPSLPPPVSAPQVKAPENGNGKHGGNGHKGNGKK